MIDKMDRVEKYNTLITINDLSLGLSSQAASTVTAIFAQYN